MLTEQKLQSLKQVIKESSRDEIIWMSGFLAGLSEKNITDVAPPVLNNVVNRKTCYLCFVWNGNR